MLLLPTIVFLAFTLWTLYHWQALPELLANEASTEHWPLSIHHTATPLRMMIVTALYSVFAYVLLMLMTLVIHSLWPTNYSAWIAVAVLITAHFIPILSGLSAYVRYFFQRHLFFPSLPSHQEDSIIGTLMAQAPRDNNVAKEIKYLHQQIHGEFRTPLHVINLVGLRNEQRLVKREFKQLRHKGLLTNVSLTHEEQQQMRFHLYSCYRLLTRTILSRHWAGRDRRKAFRRHGYTINTGDGEVYAQMRRIRHSFMHYLLHRNHHGGIKSAKQR